jgi:probable rRNA maturation factor
MIIEIINQQEKSEFSKEMENLIKDAINLVADEAQLSKDFEVSVTICDDESIKEINREYRNIDKSTDVLSFPMFSYSEPEVFSEEIFEGENTFGDIIISLETAIRQSEEYGHSSEREVAFLTVHSMLHLLGYDHIEDSDRALMREREEYFLEKMGQRR